MASTEGAAGNGQVYYVVRLNDNDSVCVVPGDQLQPSLGSRLAIGATCEVAREGGGTQHATVIGVGSETAISVLENCLKSATDNMAGHQDPATSSPTTADNQQATLGVTSEGGLQGSDGATDGGLNIVRVPSDMEHLGAPSDRGQHNVQRRNSELAALLSPAKTLMVAKSPEKMTFKQPKKRPVAMDTIETSDMKKKKVDEKKTTVSAKIAVIPTVVPARPQAVTGGLGRDSSSTPSKKPIREIDPPPPAGEKKDTLSQILHELHELKRSYATLAGSLLIVRRNQDDIKTRLTEIGISIVTHSSDPLMLSTESTVGSISGLPREDSLAISSGLGDSLNEGIVMGDPDNPHTLQGIDLEASFPEFDPEYLIVSRGKSCSRRNFAVNLVRYLFTSEDMAMSNCSGTRGKSRLEPERMAVVRRVTFALWPVEEKEDLGSEWAKCIYSIDEACRRLNRPKFRKRKDAGGEDGVLHTHHMGRGLESYLETEAGSRL